MSTTHTNGADEPSSGAVPPPPGRPPLRRSKDDRILGGLAAGLARHFGMDVSIVRILMVLVTFLTQGLGLLAYIVGVLVVPEDDDSAPSAPPPGASQADSRRSAGFWVGISLLIFGAMWLFGGFWRFGGWIAPDVVLALVLIGFGVALWRSSEQRDSAAPSDSSAASPGTAPAPAANVPLSASEAHAGQTPGTDLPPPAATTATDVPPTAASSWQPPPPVQRERSILGRLTLGVAFVIVGALWLLRIAGVLTIGPRHLVAAALAVVGLGLIVGAFAGRARWLILIGLLLVPVVIASSVLRPGMPLSPLLNIQDGAGQVHVAPIDMDELQSSYRLGAGQHIIDLRELDIDTARTVAVQVGAGEVVIRLPADVTATVNTRVGIGQVRWQGLDGGAAAQGGFGVERTVTVNSGAGSPPLNISVQLGAGEIRIEAPVVAERDSASMTPPDSRMPLQPAHATTTKEF